MNPQRAPNALIISRRDIIRLMNSADYLRAVEQAFRAAAVGKAYSPHPMHLPVERGGFHAKGASISLESEYVAVKVNANFPDNPAKLGLPTVQGAIMLADGSNGVLLAILDSIEVTLRRTAAASALAAQHLARSDAHTLLVCGCGEQGRAHVTPLREVLPLRRCLLWDQDYNLAQTMAQTIAVEVGMEVAAVRDLKSASLSADVIACCTSARQHYLDTDLVKPGTFITAVGADNSDKTEIAPRLMADAVVVTDVLDQCSAMGDLHHAIAAQLMTEADVRAELGDVIVGAKRGRHSPDEIIIFDSTGTGLQDVAACALIYERCKGNSSVQRVALAAA